MIRRQGNGDVKRILRDRYVEYYHLPLFFNTFEKSELSKTLKGRL
jgi:hypothetical protein